MSFHTTISEGDDDYPRPGPAGAVLALVVAWCREESWRVGEGLLVPQGPGRPVARFGRGPAVAGEPTKSLLGRLRPGGWLPSLPLGGSAISRSQLELQALGPDRVHVRNVGKCSLLIRNTVVSEAQVGPGDLLQLGKQMLFICVRRPSSLSDFHGPADFPFGEADDNGIVGESPAIWELRRQIALVAPRAGHVLITGCSGSGKELVAQAIHALSPRAGRPMVARNAVTLPETLIDAELFGNARNYPNPGMPDRGGLIGSANRSTLFLDEVAELPQTAQAHLLRVLDAGEYQRLGETSPLHSDFRLIAATNRDVSALKHDFLGRFAFHIAVPPLASRREDVPLLVRHLLRTTPDLRAACGPSLAEPEVSLDLARRLMGHRFATGVRELRRLLWRALTTPGGEVECDADRGASIAPIVPREDERDDAEPGLPSRALVQDCLDRHNGVIELAWRALGLNNRFVLLRLVKRYDIEIRRRPGRGRPGLLAGSGG